MFKYEITKLINLYNDNPKYLNPIFPILFYFIFKFKLIYILFILIKLKNCNAKYLIPISLI